MRHRRPHSCRSSSRNCLRRMTKVWGAFCCRSEAHTVPRLDLEPPAGGAHSVHPSWIPGSDHSSARGESARRSDDSSRGIRSWQRHAEEYPLLWSSLKLERGHRDGPRKPRRGQNRRIRTPARATLSDRRARVCSKGQFGLSDPDARPDVNWSLADSFSESAAWHIRSGCARDSKEATQGIGPCSGKVDSQASQGPDVQVSVRHGEPVFQVGQHVLMGAKAHSAKVLTGSTDPTSRKAGNRGTRT